MSLRRQATREVLRYAGYNLLGLRDEFQLKSFPSVAQSASKSVLYSMIRSTVRSATPESEFSELIKFVADVAASNLVYSPGLFSTEPAKRNQALQDSGNSFLRFHLMPLIIKSALQAEGS